MSHRGHHASRGATREQVYASIAEHGPSTTSQIAQRLSLDSSTIHYHLRLLIDTGRVAKHSAPLPKGGQVKIFTIGGPIPRGETVTVSCPDCGADRQVHPSTARRGPRRCLSCAKIASHHTSTAVAPDWRKRAACREAVDPEVFFPLGEPGSKKYDEVAAIAKALCSFCPVITDCLEDVLRTGDSHGIRGGLDPDERAKQFPTPPKRRRPAYPCAQCGIGMGAPKNKGNNKPRYCSDACRGASKKRRQAEYDQRRKAVAV